MFRGPPREKRWISWLLVAAWTAVIYIAIPFARTFQAWVSRHAGRAVFTDVVLVFVVLFVGGVLLYTVHYRRSLPWCRLPWLAVIGAVYASLTWRLGKRSPEEALHFVEYAVLGLLLYRAFCHRMRDRLVYVAVFLAGGIIGTVDEIIQWITPLRFWDFRDVGLNVLSVALALVAIDRGIRPAIIQCRIRPRSIRRVTRLAMAWTLLVLVCLVNTPPLMARYTRWIPGLDFLRHSRSMMTEYGYLHSVGPQVHFKSRLSAEELQRRNQEEAVETAAILQQYRDGRLYSDFLEEYTPVTDPYVHELRVRLFRRDHYRGVIWKYADDPEMEAWHATVAWRENQILEHYYDQVLVAADWKLSDSKREGLKALADPDLVYLSPVSGSLITCCSPWVPAIGLTLLLVVLWIIERRWGREKTDS
jgi:hypothetical protein